MDLSPQTSPLSPERSEVLPDSADPRPEEKIRTVSSLLQHLDEATTTYAQPARRSAEVRHEDRLAQSRLGVASGLLAALRAKDPSSAAHSLRVALGCSAWSLALEITDQERDELEIAALLHDIGKVGVPDHVLLKPGHLTREEVALMERYRQHGLDILCSCCVSEGIVDIVRFFPAWYDGSSSEFDRSGGDLPLGARMLAIVDAFDSMTSDHGWRRAKSRERASAELFEFAGRQFDPDLVHQFCTLQSQSLEELHAQVTCRWLNRLDPQASSLVWGLEGAPREATPNVPQLPFHAQFVDHIHDAVLFVDTDAQVEFWNQAAEQLTGIPSGSVLGRRWSCDAVKMLDEHRRPMEDADCPLRQAMESGMPVLRRLTIAGRGFKNVQVNAHAIPVVDADGARLGAILQLHDVSPETHLQQRVQSLHEKATHDPLTKVANRAEFDRGLERMVETHVARRQPCSLIICDIDHFKRINDTYGHQAGDDVLTSFAALLKRKCRPGDMVARYGGEEFVLLCADCDNTAATRRAEAIRKELANVPQAVLRGTRVTSSFGVTELQAGDTPATFLRRADRALYQAKDRGRNLVVQLGTGYRDSAAPVKRNWWASLFGGPARVLLERQLVTAVPINMAIEKLRGFIADHHAEIESSTEDQVVLKIEAAQLPLNRRATDRPVPFFIELTFSEKRVAIRNSKAPEQGKLTRTIVHVTIRPRRSRDRRRRDADQRAAELLMSLKSYLMGHELHELDELTRAAVTDEAAAAGC
jgi:diguanylate cyclase (GGDEF)-like protein/PAS domain S-box-containing protein